MSVNNPYGQASDAYGNTAAETDQRMLEAKVLLKAATQLELMALRFARQEKIKREEWNQVVDSNRKLWILFASEMSLPENPLPEQIKANISSLAVFIVKRSLDICFDPQPEKFKVLIDINRNIASGLMKQAQLKPVAPAAAQKPAPQPAGSLLGTDSFA